MAKFVGLIGYARPVETSPGVWVDEVTEKTYRGDIVTDKRYLQSSDQLNDNVNVENAFSIIANDYAYQNLGIMKYIVWHGVAWKIQSFTIERPRLVLRIGGIYNGERPIISP